MDREQPRDTSNNRVLQSLQPCPSKRVQSHRQPIFFKIIIRPEKRGEKKKKSSRFSILAVLTRQLQAILTFTARQYTSDHHQLAMWSCYIDPPPDVKTQGASCILQSPAGQSPAGSRPTEHGDRAMWGIPWKSRPGERRGP